jgi:signal peptidase I
MLKKLAAAIVIVSALTVGLLVLALMTVLGGRTFRAPSESMLPTIRVGERLMTTKVSEPGRGDIVVLNPPAGAEKNVCGVRVPANGACPRATPERSKVNFIKRVAAVAGDRLSIRGGRTVIDGEVQEEPYIRADRDCPACNLPDEITVPRGHVFVMGDNRGASADSREWGPVPEDAVLGKVRLRYWPPSRAGTP